MITDLGKEIQHQEPQPSTPSIKPFTLGMIKEGPSGRTEGRETWSSPDIEIKSIGRVTAYIAIPRDEQAVDESSEWRDNQPVFVVDRNGEVSEGTSNEYLEGFGALHIRLGPPEKIVYELYTRQNLLGEKVPKVMVDVLVRTHGKTRFRGLIEHILGEDSVCEFRMADSEGRTIGKPKPVLFAADEELLRKINIAFESYTELPQKGEAYGY